MANSSLNEDKSSYLNSDLTACLLSRQENLQYRAEGNSSLVVRLVKENFILRIPKIDNKETESSYVKSPICNSADEAFQILQMRRCFAQDVLKYLIGATFIPHMEILHLTKENIKSINSAVEKQRPIFRMHKGLSELPSGCYAVLMPDLCTSVLPEIIAQDIEAPKSSGIISVEIKPKQGYMNDSEFFLNELDETLVNNFSICKFCLKQFLKIREGRYKVQSHFCPMDLYSGCDSRMKGCLKELLKNPQNNLRIFKDGEIIFDGEKLDSGESDLWQHLEDFIGKKRPTFSEEEFIHILIKALKWTPSDNQTIQLPKKLISENCQLQNCRFSKHNCLGEKCDEESTCKHKLPTGCVLDAILRVQTLGNSSLNTVLPYLKYFDSQPLMLQMCNYFTLGSPNLLYPSSRMPENVGEVDKPLNEDKWHFYTRKIWEYLVSLTAKDCSIIISLQPFFGKLENKYEEHILQSSTGKEYLVQVKVVDLDPKPVHNIIKNYDGNKKLVNEFTTEQAQVI